MRFLSLAVASAIASSLAGCGGKKSTTQAGTTQAATSPQNPAAKPTSDESKSSTQTDSQKSDTPVDTNTSNTADSTADSSSTSQTASSLNSGSTAVASLPSSTSSTDSVPISTPIAKFVPASGKPYVGTTHYDYLKALDSVIVDSARPVLSLQELHRMLTSSFNFLAQLMDSTEWQDTVRLEIKMEKEKNRLIRDYNEEQDKQALKPNHIRLNQNQLQAGVSAELNTVLTNQHNTNPRSQAVNPGDNIDANVVQQVNRLPNGVSQASVLGIQSAITAAYVAMREKYMVHRRQTLAYCRKVANQQIKSDVLFNAVGCTTMTDLYAKCEELIVAEADAASNNFGSRQVLVGGVNVDVRYVDTVFEKMDNLAKHMLTMLAMMESKKLVHKKKLEELELALPDVSAVIAAAQAKNVIVNGKLYCPADNVQSNEGYFQTYFDNRKGLGDVHGQPSWARKPDGAADNRSLRAEIESIGAGRANWHPVNWHRPQ